MSKRDWCWKVNFRGAKNKREGGCQKEKQQEPVLGKRLDCHIFLMTTLRIVAFSSRCREEEWRTKARGLRPGSCDFSVSVEQCVRGTSKLEKGVCPYVCVYSSLCCLSAAWTTVPSLPVIFPSRLFLIPFIPGSHISYSLWTEESGNGMLPFPCLSPEKSPFHFWSIWSPPSPTVYPSTPWYCSPTSVTVICRPAP